ncbi:Rha family transcriptional regulator [Xanthobacter sp. TB0136]|uniref:Rha family transcriptional regulator n=1 Tax=Xanthobacter sp. TB0136 TaxID=3459177 RepID=UPI0040396A92
MARLERGLKEPSGIKSHFSTNRSAPLSVSLTDIPQELLDYLDATFPYAPVFFPWHRRAPVRDLPFPLAPCLPLYVLSRDAVGWVEGAGQMFARNRRKALMLPQENLPTELHQELREEGRPTPWRPSRSIPNPWAAVAGDPADPKVIPVVMTGTDGKPVANSRDVAAHFGKQHKNVLRDIEAMITDDPACRLNFELTSQTVAMPRGGTRQEPAYLMDRDGFTLLAMGFTGKKALQFKRAYVAAYNALEAGALAAMKRQAEVQRTVDALNMAKAVGLIGPDTKKSIRKVLMTS